MEEINNTIHTILRPPSRDDCSVRDDEHSVRQLMAYS